MRNPLRFPVERFCTPTTPWVLPLRSAALALHESAGWREVLRVRPAWLPDALGDEGPDVRVMVLPG